MRFRLFRLTSRMGNVAEQRFGLAAEPEILFLGVAESLSRVSLGKRKVAVGESKFGGS